MNPPANAGTPPANNSGGTTQAGPATSPNGTPCQPAQTGNPPQPPTPPQM
jgi:hypothetical protein